MSKEICKNCFYLHCSRRDVNGSKDYYQCRKNPPTAIEGFLSPSKFPNVYLDDDWWCYSFKQKKEVTK